MTTLPYIIVFARHVFLEIPTTKLFGKGRELLLLVGKVNGHDFLFELFSVVDLERMTVWQP